MTPPKTPQLNCLAESMNKTLVERVRCVLSEAKLPNSFCSLDGDVPNRVCWAISHVPAKGPWPNPTWKRIGIILFIWFPILLGKGLEL